jgi:hypothetical protein
MQVRVQQRARDVAAAKFPTGLGPTDPSEAFRYGMLFALTRAVLNRRWASREPLDGRDKAILEDAYALLDRALSAPRDSAGGWDFTKTSITTLDALRLLGIASTSEESSSRLSGLPERLKQLERIRDMLKTAVQQGSLCSADPEVLDQSKRTFEHWSDMALDKSQIPLPWDENDYL